MTIELSIRKRAALSQRLSIVWIVLAISFVAVTYASFPSFAGKMLRIAESSVGDAYRSSVNTVSPVAPDGIEMKQAHVVFTVLMVCLLSIISYAVFLLGRCAMRENEMAARLCGLADALCISGNDLARFERAASVLVPKAKSVSDATRLRSKELDTLATALKELK